MAEEEWFRLRMGGPKNPHDLFYAMEVDLSDTKLPDFLDFLCEGWQPSKEYEDILVPVTFPSDTYYPRIEDVLLVMDARGLSRPTPQHALQFGIQYPNKQRERPHIFPHECWTEKYENEKLIGEPRVLALIGNEHGRRIDLSSTKWPWSSGYVYLGVKPRS
jgi:hypothetical protein